MFVKIAVTLSLLTLCLAPASVMGKTYHSSDNQYYSGRDYDQRHRQEYRTDDNRRDQSREQNQRYRVGYGWNPSKEVWKWNPECHHYTIRISPGGPASVRIESIPGDNKSFRAGEGVYKGYVCFKRGGKLMLAKMNRDTRVKFSLDDYGDFIFESGDRGNRHENNWFRAYWNL